MARADWIVVQMSDWLYRWFVAIRHSPPIMMKKPIRAVWIPRLWIY